MVTPKMGCDVNIYTDSLSSVRKWMLFFTAIWWGSIEEKKNGRHEKKFHGKCTCVYSILLLKVYALQSIATLAASVHIHALEGDATISGATCLSGATSIQTNTGCHFDKLTAVVSDRSTDLLAGRDSFRHARTVPYRALWDGTPLLTFTNMFICKSRLHVGL